MDDFAALRERRYNVRFFFYTEPQTLAAPAAKHNTTAPRRTPAATLSGTTAEYATTQPVANRQRLHRHQIATRQRLCGRD